MITAEFLEENIKETTLELPDDSKILQEDLDAFDSELTTTIPLAKGLVKDTSDIR